MQPVVLLPLLAVVLALACFPSDAAGFVSRIHIHIHMNHGLMQPMSAPLLPLPPFPHRCMILKQGLALVPALALVLAVDLADEISPTNVFAPAMSLRGMLVPSKVCNTTAMPVPPVQRKSLVSQC